MKFTNWDFCVMYARGFSEIINSCLLGESVIELVFCLT